MKQQLIFLILTIFLSLHFGVISAQTISIAPELKDIISLSIAKDRKIADNDLDKQITQVRLKAVRASYIPKVELGGKYLFAYSKIDSKIGDVTGFESFSKLQQLMQNPAFPTLFPNLAGIASELTKLEELMAAQGMSFPTIGDNLAGELYGNYVGIDASTKMLLYSGGQVPNLAKALDRQSAAQDALSDKCVSDVINDVITAYDQFALLKQSKIVLDKSANRLAEEKRYASLALKNGLATSFDTLKIAVADANLQAKIADYESKRTLLLHKLSQLTGKPAANFENLNPALELIVYADTSTDISNRAELRALTAKVDAQKFMLKAEKSHSLPKVQALASVRYDHIFKADNNFSSPIPMDMKIDYLSLGPTVMAGVGFKWEVFDRSGGSAKVRQAALEVKKAENSREQARELLQLNQTKVFNEYQAAGTQVSYKDKQRFAARRALELAQKSYKEGVINITERLASETDVQNAELEYLQSVFAQRQATLECLKATGRLTPANIK